MIITRKNITAWGMDTKEWHVSLFALGYLKIASEEMDNNLFCDSY